MKLHPVIHDYNATLWCGHAALSALTGRTTSACLHYLRIAAKEKDMHYGKQRRLRGVYTAELLQALLHFGFQYEALYVKPRGIDSVPNNTLSHHITTFKDGKAYLVLIPGHFITISGNVLVDNKNKEGILLTESKYLYSDIERIYEIREITCEDL